MTMNDTDYIPEDVPEDDDADAEYSLESTAFNIDDEYKEDPLAPLGTYNGVVKLVSYNKKQNCIVWDIVAVQNEGILLLDGVTDINGTEYQYKNWLPKPGDEKLRTKNGKSNKRQTKINMLSRFQDDMEIDMNTPQAVITAMEEGEWIGISVIFSLTIDTYQGVRRNQISMMQRAEEEFDLPEFDADTDIPY